MMNSKKGFTLVELLAVISVLGVVMILALPTMLKALGNAKKLLSEYDIVDIEEAGKMYVTDMDQGVLDYKLTEDFDGRVKKYHAGDTIKGYDLKLYLASNKIDVTMKTLVEGGYYNQGCKYAGTEHRGEILTKDLNCKAPSTCIVHVSIDADSVENGDYIVTKNYVAEVDIASCGIGEK